MVKDKIAWLHNTIVSDLFLNGITGVKFIVTDTVITIIIAIDYEDQQKHDAMN